MAIDITEKMELEVPMDVAWRFISDPDRVAHCMPGAELVEQLDEKTYLGKAKVKLGAITTAYKGRVTFDEVDESAHSMRLTGEGRETGGGTARGTLTVRLAPGTGDRVEMSFEIHADLTGRVMQMGRGMIKGVSTQLFKQFAKNARSALEDEMSNSGETVTALPSPDTEAVAVGSLVGRTLWQMLLDFFKGLFGRKSA